MFKTLISVYLFLSMIVHLYSQNFSSTISIESMFSFRLLSILALSLFIRFLTVLEEEVAIQFFLRNVPITD